jgi:hypothetical protein
MPLGSFLLVIREMQMRCYTAALAMLASAALLPVTGLSAAPVNRDTALSAESPEQLCDRLAADPFVGFGPDEWAVRSDRLTPIARFPLASEP